MAGYEYFVTQFSVVDEKKSFRGSTAGVNYFFSAAAPSGVFNQIMVHVKPHITHKKTRSIPILEH